MISTLLSACMFFLLLLFPSSVHAARILTITADKTTLLGEEEMVITASASGFTDGETIVVKGAFFQGQTSNYFGLTKKDDAWIKNSAATTTQRSVKIGEWDGKVLIKSDFSDSGYKGEGEYNLKLGFYVGTSTSVNWSTNNVVIALYEPDPTETPYPTATNTLDATLVPTPTPSSSPAIFHTQTPTPTFVKVTISPVVSSILLGEDAEEIPDILGLEEENKEGTKAATKESSITKSLVIALLLVSTGTGLFALSSLLTKIHVWHIKEKNQ